MLDWLRRFSIFSFLDNGGYSFAPHRYDCLAGAGVRQVFQRLADLPAGEWVFGSVPFEAGSPPFYQPHEEIGADDNAPFFFVPEVVLRLRGSTLTIVASHPETVWQELQAMAPAEVATSSAGVVAQPLLSKAEYIAQVEKVLHYLHRGDAYEVNLCMPFRGSGRLDPFDVFRSLCLTNPAPYAALLRMGERWTICASPERFLCREGSVLISQPMKGTARRGQPAAEDAARQQALYHSAKDRAENVMVVDLVRNDLSRVCEPGTVVVTALFEIQTFPSVHQMVSTVEGVQASGVSLPQIWAALFPMGSMTGAPKRRVCEIIRECEVAPRGPFSGSIGYLQPNGDFDFNVVIRSIFYNDRTNEISFGVGSGITVYSDPEAEWAECLLKAEALQRVLAP